MTTKYQGAVSRFDHGERFVYLVDDQFSADSYPELIKQYGVELTNL